MNENENLVPKRRFKEFTNTGTWEQRKLEDLGSFKNGMNFDKSAMGHGHPFINLQNIFGKTVVDDKDLGLAVSSEKQRNEYNLLKGDILFIRSSVKPEGVGEAALVPKNFENTTFSGFIIRFRPHITVDDEFKRVIFATKTVRNQIMALATSSANTNINQISLGKIIIELPELSEQSKIGNLFKQLDNAIALHQRKLDKAKELKSAYLSEMFPAEGERKPKRRFAGFIDDWKQGTVGEYGYFYYGKSAPKWSVTKDAIIPCVRYGELYTKFGAKIDKVYSYTNISKENLKFSTGNEVLVPRVGEDPLDFANCSWLSIPNVAIGEMISVYNTEENPLFISYYFNSQLRHAFAKRVEGGNVSNLYFTYLENITISIPNKEEQDTIANFLESLDSVVEHHQHKLEKLKNIKQAYLNELFV